MDERTLEALRASIKHWEEIVGLDDDAIQEPPIGPRHCALCLLFNTREAVELDKTCAGCPVDKAGFFGCVDTPYDEVEAEIKRDAEPAEIRAAARAELEFLRALEPKDEGTPRHG